MHADPTALAGRGCNAGLTAHVTNGEMRAYLSAAGRSIGTGVVTRVRILPKLPWAWWSDRQLWRWASANRQDLLTPLGDLSQPRRK